MFPGKSNRKNPSKEHGKSKLLPAKKRYQPGGRDISKGDLPRKFPKSRLGRHVTLQRRKVGHPRRIKGRALLRICPLGERGKGDINFANGKRKSAGFGESSSATPRRRDGGDHRGPRKRDLFASKEGKKSKIWGIKTYPSQEGLIGVRGSKGWGGLSRKPPPAPKGYLAEIHTLTNEKFEKRAQGTDAGVNPTKKFQRV